MPLEYKMYAVVKDSYVIDLAFDSHGKIESPMTSTIYNNEEYSIIEMTLENSPAKIGSFYNGKTFEF